MLTTDGVASADSGMLRVRRTDDALGTLLRGEARCCARRGLVRWLGPRRASGERKQPGRLGDPAFARGFGGHSKPPHLQGAADARLRGSAPISEERVSRVSDSRWQVRDLPFTVVIPHSAIRNPHFRVSARSALTLIELLAVIAIIGVLMAITFGIARGVHERAGVGKARVEIATIAQALEAYRVKYGDYPQTSSGATMLQCLIGRRGPTGAALSDKPLIELARFSTVDDADPFTSTTAELMDPFGEGYHYAYKASGSWRNASFVLYTGGPDGAVEGTLPADGFLTSAFETAFNFSSGTGNPDNIYHGRN